MQLGIRWRAGEKVHHSVPHEMHDAIRTQETEHPDAEFWTLSWLEGRPRCALDSTLILTIDSAGRVVIEGEPSGVTHQDSEDDWLN